VITGLITGRAKVIAHLGFPTEAFKASLIYNPWFDKQGIETCSGHCSASPTRMAPS